MADSKHPLLLAAAVAYGVLSLGHTVCISFISEPHAMRNELTVVQSKGLEQFKHTSIRALPTALRGAVKAGWYEGSGFLLISGAASLLPKFQTHYITSGLKLTHIFFLSSHPELQVGPDGTAGYLRQEHCRAAVDYPGRRGGDLLCEW
jgi:hypothetical protein